MTTRSTRGFSLLEIVVALAILGMGVAVVMQIFSGGLKNIHRIDMAHQAMNHAENVMNEILSNEAVRGEPDHQICKLGNYTVQIAGFVN